MPQKPVVLLTCAGLSERFPSYDHGKWAITHPLGTVMAREALRGMSGLDNWRVIAAVNGTDSERFGEDRIAEAIGAEVINVGVTPNRLETIRRALNYVGVNGDTPVVVRDCDNHLAFGLDDVFGVNAVVTYPLKRAGLVDPATRSYVETDESGVVTRADEDLGVRAHFAAGAYAFESARVLLRAVDRFLLSVTKPTLTNLLRLLERRPRDVQATAYVDWGTETDWDRFKSSWRTLFVDIDGTLFEAAHAIFGERPQGWNLSIEANIEALRQLQQGGRTCIILTTSRTSHGTPGRAGTVAQLRGAGVPYDQLVMDLPVCGRCLVNDYDPARLEVTAGAVLLERGTSTLARELARGRSR